MMTGSLKNSKKALAKDSKVTWNPDFSSTYHLANGPVGVHLNNLKRMESSMMLFEQHHKWKVMTWLVGYSLIFPSNFGIFEGSLVGILGHVGSCKIGSFMSLFKSGMLRDTKYGMGCISGGLVPAMV
jgi:hypothetical protein